MFDRRDSQPRRKALVLGVLSAMAAVLLVWSAVQLSVATASNCQQIELLKSSIRATLIRSAQMLGRPGTAGYEYYREHPVELQEALKAQNAAIQTFAPKSC